MSNDQTTDAIATVINPDMKAKAAQSLADARERLESLKALAARQPHKAAAWIVGSLLALVLLVLLLGGSGIDDPRTAAQACVAALRSGDFDELEALVCTTDDVEDIYDEMGPDKKSEMRKHSEERGGFDVMAKEARTELRRSYGSVLKEGARHFSWDDVRFETVDVRDRGVKEGLRQADITAVVSSEGRSYRIVMSRCIKAPRGWICRRLKFGTL